MNNHIIKEPTSSSYNKIWMVIILGLLTAFGPLSMDMYLPSLPTVADDFGSTASLAQLSITSCLIGLALGQLVFGPLSDIVGRKKPLIITVTIYTIVSLLCYFSPGIWLFIILRFIQGTAAASGIVIARAASRDMYSGKELTKFMALLALVNGAAPILAPLFGGVILNWFTWRTIFVFLAMIGLVMLISVSFTLPETLPHEHRKQGDLIETLKTFGLLLKDKVFMGIALSQAFVVMSMFAYIAGSPFVLQNIYGVSPQQFSVIFAVNGLGIIIAAQLTGKLSSTIEEIDLLKAGVIMSFIGSLLLIVVVMFSLPIWAILPALFLVVSSAGVVNTTSFSLGMQRQGEVAGSASAFLGILPFGGGALVSPFVGIMGESTMIPLGIVILICSTMALIIYTLLLKHNPISVE